MKYRKKPVVIEAIQWDGSYYQSKLIEKEFPELHTTSKEFNEDADVCWSWRINTLEDAVTVSKNDWVIKGIKGEFYPCKPDIFEATYEAVCNK